MSECETLKGSLPKLLIRVYLSHLCIGKSKTPIEGADLA